jgi:hypothetical protein
MSCAVPASPPSEFFMRADAVSAASAGIVAPLSASAMRYGARRLDIANCGCEESSRPMHAGLGWRISIISILFASARQAAARCV